MIRPGEERIVCRQLTLSGSRRKLVQATITIVVKASVTTIAAFAGTESRQSFIGQPKIALKNLPILPGGFGFGTGGIAGPSDIDTIAFLGSSDEHRVIQHCAR